MNSKENSTGAPALATIAVTERLDAVTAELSLLMGQYSSGRLVAVVGAHGDVRFVPPGRFKHDTVQAFLDNASPSSVIEYHLSQLTLAMRKQRPGSWVGQLSEGGDEATVRRFPDSEKNEAWISFLLPMPEGCYDPS